jgi:hypothetical protein
MIVQSSLNTFSRIFQRQFIAYGLNCLGADGSACCGDRSVVS